MPNYHGIDVLQYECNLLKQLNNYDNAERLVLHASSDLYSEDVLSSLIETHKSLIACRSEQLSVYQKKLEEFQKTHEPSSTTISEDPLEFLYQEFLQKKLPDLLRRIENTYKNYCDSLLSQEVAHLQLTAKRIAKHYLYQSGIDSIISKLIYEEKFRELTSLPSALFPDAIYPIQKKYDYFNDRIQCCLEIGNLLRSL